MLKEEWKDVCGYEGLYIVSNTGKVASYLVRGHAGIKTITPKILKARKNNNGYMIISLYGRNKTKKTSIHRVVATSWLENKEMLPHVAHLDGNKENNHISNLKWCTVSENCLHKNIHGTRQSGEKNGNHKLLDKDREIIRKSNISAKQLSHRYSVNESTIRRIKKQYK